MAGETAMEIHPPATLAHSDCGQVVLHEIKPERLKSAKSFSTQDQEI
jgi:hypothetical protein